ncbi:hypothetical protein LguiA_014540 [Lonicera macranthoides]
MESIKLNLFVVVVMMLMAVMTVQQVAAADSPAPSPTSDATVFLPTAFASLAAITFGFLL